MTTGTHHAAPAATTDREVAMLHFTHTLSGRTFTVEAPGSYGATSADGHWDTGEAGTIWPGETLRDGAPVWVAA